MGANTQRSLHSPVDRFLRLPDVEQIVGIKRSTIYRQVAAEAFPKPIRLGPNTVAWRESDIQSWMDGKVSASAEVRS